MSFKFIFRDRKGKNGKLKQSIEQKCALDHRDPQFSFEGLSSSSYHVAQQSLWASLPSELLLDVINRVEASEITWPAHRAVVSCAAVCISRRYITREVVRTPEEGPRDSLIQCFIRRERATSTYRLYLVLSPALSRDGSKLHLVAKRIKKATKIDLSIPCSADNFSQTNDNYSGKLSFFGQKRGLLICFPDTELVMAKQLMEANGIKQLSVIKRAEDIQRERRERKIEAILYYDSIWNCLRDELNH